jgi:hypothetical protein
MFEVADLAALDYQSQFVLLAKLDQIALLT